MRTLFSDFFLARELSRSALTRLVRGLLPSGMTAKPPHDKKKLPKRSAEHAYDDLAPVEGLRWAPERF